MALIVKKFGGTSLATPSHITHLAQRIHDDIRRGNQVVVVVSAMGESTDDLVNMANQICDNPYQREMDMLLTAGERISMALFSMALNSAGIKAYSFTGSQVGIITTGQHTKAKIMSVKGDRLIEALNNGITPIVAGFQGVSVAREITTLGRGGSDTTAVTLAAFLKADVCEIYTDVDGVFTVNPRQVPNARLLKRISYEEMLAMASLGSQVMHPRSIEIAMRHNVNLYVKSSFKEGEGTMISSENIESVKIRGISTRDNLSSVVLKTDKGIAEITGMLSVNGIEPEFYINRTGDTITLITESDNVNKVLSITEECCASVSINNDIGSVSIVGTGVKGDPEILKTVSDISAKYSNDIIALSYSEMALSIITKKHYIAKIAADAAGKFGLVNND